MNYYPNYYMNNYPYNGNNSGQYIPQTQTYAAPGQQLPQFLNGQVVDSADVVKATEVPIGGYGIFPKADLSEIYIKSWNNNGTTSIITFTPIPPETQSEVKQDDTIMEILNKINNLEEKIDSLTTHNNVKTTPNTTTVRKDSKANEY